MLTTAELKEIGATLLAKTTTGVVCTGSLTAMKKVALAHGLILGNYRGRWASSADGTGTHLPGDEKNFCWADLLDVKGEYAGILHRERDDWSAVVNLAAWEGKTV